MIKEKSETVKNMVVRQMITNSILQLKGIILEPLGPEKGLDEGLITVTPNNLKTEFLIFSESQLTLNMHVKLLGPVKISVP